MQLKFPVPGRWPAIARMLNLSQAGSAYPNLGLVRVLESEVPSDAVSFGLVKRKVEEYNLHLWTESARPVMLVTLRSPRRYPKH